MSDSTPYNEDVLAGIKARAKRKGLSVTVRGHNVFTHPKGVRIPPGRGNPDNPKDPYGKYWVMWAMEW